MVTPKSLLQRSLSAVGLLGWLLAAPVAIAQTQALNQAEIYRLQNQVQLIPNQQSARPARIEDILIPRDALRTGQQSRAELLFNEGTLARIGSNSAFRFVPGLRRYQLPNGSVISETILQLSSGVALVISPPGSVATQVQTSLGTATMLLSGEQSSDNPNAVIEAPPGVSVIVIEKGENNLRVLNLTQQPVEVESPDGTETATLGAGQIISATSEGLGEVQTFDLQQFYRTSSLTEGLGPNQTDQDAQTLPVIRELLQTVQPELLAALNAQSDWLAGLCSLGASGVSNQSPHCITTSDDDPLNQFENEREDTFNPSEPPPSERPDPRPCVLDTATGICS